MEVERDGDRDLGAEHVANLGDREAVRKVEVVHSCEGDRGFGASGSVHAGAVPEVGGTPRLVQGGPGVHPVAELLRHEAGVPGEGVGGLAVAPASGILQLLRKIPVVQRDNGLNAGCAESVEQGDVELHTLGVERT